MPPAGQGMCRLCPCRRREGRGGTLRRGCLIKGAVREPDPRAAPPRLGARRRTRGTRPCEQLHVGPERAEPATSLAERRVQDLSRSTVPALLWLLGLWPYV